MIKLGAKRAPKLDATDCRSGLRPQVVANKLALVPHGKSIACATLFCIALSEPRNWGGHAKRQTWRRSSATWSAEETLLLFFQRLAGVGSVNH